MNYIDLHTHSVFSDGTFTPSELIERAKALGLSAIALTDHDTIDGLSEAIEASKRLNIEFINGVEIAADYKDTEIHIVGLLFDRTSTILSDSLLEMEKRREIRNKELVLLFNEEGIKMKYEDILNKSDGKIITRAHFARFLMEEGYVESINDAFLKYLSPGKKTYMKRELLSSSEAIELIHKAGGIAILAHPGEYGFSEKQLEEMVHELKKQNIDAIEAIYTTNSIYTESFHRDLAKRYHLKISGGSDFHGSNKPEIELGKGFGNLKIPYEILNKLRDRAL
ncbi:PHP domain-containing protein [Anaeropeptidivorans aminofermentans]|jgi:hypothetical protein|uniref:PHP domain-containing protein n=1 Tax=Anaeropeptidivorans aminofermentans TaxID=2934315 RepID=UPI002024A619|nr:PHP domain-containing protein [Anaeropeptidivorans aminofermentans]